MEPEGDHHAPHGVATAPPSAAGTKIKIRMKTNRPEADQSVAAESQGGSGGAPAAQAPISLLDEDSDDSELQAMTRSAKRKKRISAVVLDDDDDEEEEPAAARGQPSGRFASVQAPQQQQQRVRGVSGTQDGPQQRAAQRDGKQQRRPRYSARHVGEEELSVDPDDLQAGPWLE